MKPLVGPEFDLFRVELPPILERLNPGAKQDERNGAFVFKNPIDGVHSILRVIACSGGGWDHVSVSTATRCPTWEEMNWIKRRFFKRSEVAMQLHVGESDHISNHPYTLHLWRPLKGTIPLPPKGYV